MRRRLPIFPLVALILSGALSWVIAGAIVARIESSTRQQAVTALAAAGQNWADAQADGTLLILSGQAPDESARFRALEVLGKIIDGAGIDDRSTVQSAAEAIQPDFSLEILRSEGSVSLIGLIPAQSAPLAAEVAGIAAAEPNTDLLVQSADPQPELWADSIGFALALLPDIANGSLQVVPGKVEVTAIAESDEARQQLADRLTERQPQNVALTLDIRAPLPVIAPYRFAMTLRDGSASLEACSAEDGEGRARILSAVRRVGAVEAAKCPLALGAPSASWPLAIDLAITALDELGGGALAITDTDLLLTARLGTDPGKLAQVTADLTKSLPEVFSLETVLPQTETQDAAPYRPLFSATLHADGSMSLGGAMPDPASREAAAIYAGSLLRSGLVQNRIQIDSKLPLGWASRTLAGIETLAMLNSGTLTVSPEKVYVEGRSASPDIEAEVSDALSARLGADQAISVMVVHDPSLDTTVVPPGNRECASQVADILQKRQITFAKNSGKIDEDSQLIIDDIAIVLKNCPSASFEIGGHTDSKGGEVLNQALSQARADAVLDALLARDVLIAGLSARGYGESQPIGDNETEEGRASNRRIAFKLLEGRDE